VEGVRASLELLRAGESAGDYESSWRMGRALFFLGQEATDEEEMRAQHARAIAACERAARLCPARVEGHFWLGVNLALAARLATPFKALRLALRAQSSLKRAATICPAYHAAGPLRLLARLQHKLPRLIGGGTRRARANFEKAIELAPDNTVTRLYYAELLSEEGDTVGARAQLEALLAAPSDPAWAFESARDRELARKMLAGLQD
jgi:tetratricopeptide (TPR) repeat protein